MKILLNFLALILFFLAYFISRDIYIATAVAIGASILQTILIYWQNKKIETMQWVGMLLIVVFGSATLLMQNPWFIKWKPSILYWLTALAILASVLLQKNILKKLMGKEIVLDDKVWHKLAYAWVVFFTLMGLINIGVAYLFETSTWVTYKTFGAMGLLIVFFIGQGIYLANKLSAQTSTDSKDTLP